MSLSHRIRAVSSRDGFAECRRSFVRHNAGYSKVTIDGISRSVKPPEHPEFVPQKFRKSQTADT